MQYIRNVSQTMSITNTSSSVDVYTFTISLYLTLLGPSLPYTQWIVINQSSGNNVVINGSGTIVSPAGTGWSAASYSFSQPNVVAAPPSGIASVGNQFYIDTYGFRYRPWTDCGYTFTTSGTTSFGGAITCSFTGTTNPTPAIGSICKYNYSVMGNTMNLQFSYMGGANGGGAGLGIYIWTLPPGYEIDTSLISIQNPAITAVSSPAKGTVIGNAYVVIWGVSATIVNMVYAINSTQFCVFVYQTQSGADNNWITNAHYPFSYANYYQTITCSFPII